VRGSTTSFGPSGGSGTVTITVSRECAWSASSQASWIDLTSPGSGQGGGTIGFRVEANDAPVSRRASIVVSDARVELSQEGAPCRFEVAPTPESVSADGAQLAIGIATHTACRWTAASEAPFATVAPTSGAGAGSVQLVIASNAGAARTITIVIASERRTLTQAARSLPPAPPPVPAPPNPPPPVPSPCTAQVAPVERTFTALGGTGSVQVSLPAGCAWDPLSTASWITVLTSSGSGNGELRYLVQSNGSTAPREGTITVRGAVHRVIQSGFLTGTTRLDGEVSGLSGSCPTLRFEVRDTVVLTDQRTNFRGGNCKDLRNGEEVEVEGTLQPDGSILASRVELDD
jgi:hypothetical protein